MVRKPLSGVRLVALLLISLTVLGSVLMYQTGWSRGYAAGIMTAGAQEGTQPVTSLIYPSSNGLLWGLALLIGFLALAFMGRMFRMRAWNQMTGHWGARHKGYDDSMPPWCPWYAGYEEKPEEGSQARPAEETSK
jgi:hypothetical protein